MEVFFPKSYLKVAGAAYTRLFMVIKPNWPIRPELIPVSVALSNYSVGIFYFYIE